MDTYTNFLLWGVITDEEVRKLIDSIDEEEMKKSGKWFELSKDNPYMKPKSEWTDEMRENLRKFKEKYPEL